MLYLSLIVNMISMILMIISGITLIVYGRYNIMADLSGLGFCIMFQASFSLIVSFFSSERIK
jgi:hypothetical protein